MTIIAAADGSALGNPGPAGWAWYVDEDCWAAGGWPESTNNRGELTAVLELLRATADAGEDLLIQADSQYVINSLTKWMKGWKRRGWRKADGKPVLNADLMRELDDVLRGRAPPARRETTGRHPRPVAPLRQCPGPGRCYGSTPAPPLRAPRRSTPPSRCPGP